MAKAVLVKDINPGASGSNHIWRIPVGATLYFRADDGTNGEELWKTDGTESGTVLVKDINSGSSNSTPTDLTKVDNNLFFIANDGTNGSELWISDGTESGTVLVKDINSGSSGSSSYRGVQINDKFLFIANDGTNGSELWISDGTESGTVLVKDINSGSGDASPLWLVPSEAKDIVFFNANDGTNGAEIWKTDGTESGTVLVKDINPGSSNSFPTDIVQIGDTWFFAADDGTNGIELWKTDGTETGTVLVKDINSGSSNSSPGTVGGYELNGKLLFTANDGINGEELWISDGTESGTVLLKDINPGAGSSSPLWLVPSPKGGDTVFFRADDGTNGIELWKTDGTETGTVLVKDINSGGSSTPQGLSALGNNIVFAADDGNNGEEIWISDGTESGTVLVKDINSGSSGSSISSGVAIGDKVFFKANDGNNGAELWMIDGAVFITGPSGSAGDNTSTKSIDENTTVVHTFSANESTTWSLNGGADVSKFFINSSSGALSFAIAPDYELPGDSDSNNSYVVVVRATDSAENTSDQTITISVVDVDDILPTLSSFSPVDDATEVATNSNIILNFSEAVDVETGDIVIYRTSDDYAVETIDVTDGSKVTGTGSTQITINPSSDLAEQTSYYVQIAATAFDDSSSNSYEGISNTTSLSFTTADETAPTFSSTATNIAGTKVILTYNEALSATTAANTAFAVTTDGTNNSVTDATVSGSTVELTLTTTVKNDEAVTVAYTDPSGSDDANAIQDSSGNDAVDLASTAVTNNSTVAGSSSSSSDSSSSDSSSSSSSSSDSSSSDSSSSSSSSSDSSSSDSSSSSSSSSDSSSTTTQITDGIKVADVNSSYVADSKGFASITGSTPVTVTSYEIGKETTLDSIKDYDGNLHAGDNLAATASSYKYQGMLDVNGDGVFETIFTNKSSKRWVTAKVDSTTGQIDFDDNGAGGGTRVVGIYADPLIAEGENNGGYLSDGVTPAPANFGVSDADRYVVVNGETIDRLALNSQVRFQNDLEIDNLQAKHSGDYDEDGIHEVYWKTADGTAYLRSLMHADGNIRYANYQSEAQMKEYLTANGDDSVITDITS